MTDPDPRAIAANPEKIEPPKLAWQLRRLGVARQQMQDVKDDVAPDGPPDGPPDAGARLMPRKAAADFTTGTTAVERLRPPRDLDKPEAALFATIVCSHPPERFTGADMPQLCAYVRACVDEEVASAELRAAGYVSGDRPSPWLSILKEATRRMTTFARALKLSPASRQSSPSEPDISYYERMSLLEGRRDDAAN
jgi:hypothetical protein